jgi:hypothetical protein
MFDIVLGTLFVKYIIVTKVAYAFLVNYIIITKVVYVLLVDCIIVVDYVYVVGWVLLVMDKQLHLVTCDLQMSCTIYNQGC